MLADYLQISICKDNGELFVFRYQLGEEANLLLEFVRLAKDDKSNFDWFDAAILSRVLGRRLGTNLLPNPVV